MVVTWKIDANNPPSRSFSVFPVVDVPVSELSI